MQEKDVTKHIKNLWGVLRREPDTVVIGSSLYWHCPTNIWYRAAAFAKYITGIRYFTMLGLQASGESELMENMIKNFAYMIETYGHIPNGNRTYYLSRSQPPFFALMVDLLADIKGDSILLTYMPALEKEYEFWMDGAGKLKTGQAYRRVVKLNDTLCIEPLLG